MPLSSGYLISSDRVENVLTYKGVINASGNPNYPEAIVGDVYKISVTGKIGGSSGIVVDVGDMIYCMEDASAGNHATVGDHWGILQANVLNPVSGAGSSVTDLEVPIYDGTSGNAIKGSGKLFANVDLINEAKTFSGKKTFGSAGSVGKLAISGTTSGETIIDANATASGTAYLPIAGGILATTDKTETFTGEKTFGTPGGSVDKLKIAGATSGTTIIAATPIAGSGTVTLPTTGQIATTDQAETFSGKKTFGSAGSVGKLAISGNTSGETILNSNATASGTAYLPIAGGILSTTDQIETFTGEKTFGTPGGSVDKLKIAGATSGTTIIAATPVAGSGTVTLPSTGQIATTDQAETFTGEKTFGTPGGSVAKLKIAGSTSGSTILAASPVAGSGTVTLPTSGSLKAADTLYGEMYMYENSTAETVDTNGKYKAIRNFVTGQCNGFVFNAGSTKAITAIADYGGTVLGTVLATSTTHGLSTNDIITILGTTNYNGTYKITRVDDNSFYFTSTWGATETGNWYKGSSLRASVGSAGKYRVSFGVSGDSAGSNKQYKVELNVNEVACDNISGVATFGIGTNYVEINRQGIVTIADNDYLWLSFKQVDSGTDNMTFKDANVNLTRI